MFQKINRHTAWVEDVNLLWMKSMLKIPIHRWKNIPDIRKCRSSINWKFYWSHKKLCIRQQNHPLGVNECKTKYMIDFLHQNNAHQKTIPQRIMIMITIKLITMMIIMITIITMIITIRMMMIIIMTMIMIMMMIMIMIMTMTMTITTTITKITIMIISSSYVKMCSWEYIDD